MELLLVAFIFVLNFAISIWNAYAVGKSWAEAKAHHQGGHGVWPRVMCWAGAVMSASGFTWCYLTVLSLSAYYFQLLTMHEVGIALQLGYILIIPGILASGLMITIDSWSTAYRQGGVLNYGVAAYNTYAQVHNTLSAIDTFGKAFGNVTDFFGDRKSSSSSSDDDAKGAAALVVILLVVLAIAGGIITTTVIIRKTAASTRLLSRKEMEASSEAK